MSASSARRMRQLALGHASILRARDAVLSALHHEESAREMDLRLALIVSERALIDAEAEVRAFLHKRIPCDACGTSGSIERAMNALGYDVSCSVCNGLGYDVRKLEANV